MVEQLKVSDNNVLSLEAYGGFTEVDEKYCQKLFNQKLELGFETVNILIKIDELKVSQSSIKALLEDMVWALRNYTQMGKLAIVANSSIIKHLVSVDNLFFANKEKGREERYFDISEIKEAFEFVNN